MKAFSKRIALVAALVGAALLTGCAAPKLQLTEKAYPPPRTVVIEQIPELRLGAFVGIPHLPAFTAAGDFYFAKPEGVLPTPDHAGAVTGAVVQQIAVGPPIGAGGGAAAGLVGGVMGAIIQIKAEDTQRKAMGFHEEMKQRLPGVDLGEDFMKGVRQSLEGQGIRVEMAPAKFPVRARWPVPDESGVKFETQPGDLPPVDADLYVQITPRALVTAPGPLNSYRPSTEAVLLVFDGRTKELLRKQYFRAQEIGTWLNSSYNGLLEHPEYVITELHRVLMGLVPQVVHVISAKPGTPPKVAAAPKPVDLSKVPARAPVVIPEKKHVGNPGGAACSQGVPGAC